MKDSIQEIIDLINAETKCIWIKTFEENSVIQKLKKASASLKVPMPIYEHSFATGTTRINIFSKENESIDPTMDTNRLLNSIYNITRNILPSEEEIEDIEEDGGTIIDSKNNIFILKDFHLMMENARIKRMIRDIVEGKYENYNTIIVLSPKIDIEFEHEKLFSVVEYDTPSKETIENLLENAIRAASKNDSFIAPSESEKKDIVNLCKGLTLNEILSIFKRSLTKHKTILVKEVMDYKIEVIKKSNMLEYKIPKANLDEIGGNAAFKKWVDEVVLAMSPEAEEFGCTKPKGYLALGVPGSAKTFLAEALADKMQIPFLKLDMSRILDSRVGSSEKNMAQAIRIIKATAPCLLLIDEVEKTLSGIGSSNNSDAGTMSRAIGSILEFLAEDHGVFVVMTSNDVSQLPPELTRAGRLDAIWYFGMPEHNERKEIFRIHYSKVNRVLDDKILDYAASITNGFTGAEIKEIVKISIRKSFNRFIKDGTKEVTETDILAASQEIVPISKSYQEKINYLNQFAKNRARFSNKLKNEYGCNIEANKELSKTISVLDLRR